MIRSPGLGTPWRQANWRFVQEQVSRLPADALILDVGAGRGDFAEALAGFCSIALELYPYPEIDIVCDLTRSNPFRPACFDAILLLNVLEHVYDTHALLDRLAGLLKPGGLLLVAIPFMVKLHQTPLDFVRYTHYALEKLGDQHGLEVDMLQGYYHPVFFLEEGIGNLRNAVLPTLAGARKRRGQIFVKSIQFLANQLNHLLGPGQAIAPTQSHSMAPTGYLLVYRKQEVLSSP
jgi:SAM-dependent methyltransferase